MKNNKKAIIIYHRSDFDGIFSCCIIKSYLLSEQDYNIDDILCIGWSYNDDEIDLNLLKYYKNVYLVDLHFSEDVMRKIIDSGVDFTWIDHHITAINDSKKYGYDNVPGIRNIDSAACELTWKYLYKDDNSPKIIQYVGAFDIWDKNRFDWEEVVLPIQYYLQAEFGISELKVWESYYSLISWDSTYMTSSSEQDCIEKGKIILKYLKRSWKSSIKNYSFEIEVAGKYKGIAVMNSEFSSNVFWTVKSEYDIYCVVNRFSDDNYRCSLYIEPDRILEFSAGEYLKNNYSGGGHRCAAGCVLNTENFIKLITEKKL